MSYKLLGADPELCLMKGDEFCRAGQAFENEEEEEWEGEFGVDGDGMVAEVRPPPTDSPQDMVRSIRAILKEGYLRFGLGMKAGTGAAEGHATGGHLHLGGESIKDCSESCSGTRKRKEILDVFLGAPLLALEPAKERKWRREYTSYGHWGDIRLQYHGTEYRTPSSWLVSPATTRIAFALTWLVALNFDSLIVPEEWKAKERFGWDYGGTGFNDFLVKLAKKAVTSLSTIRDFNVVAPMLEPFDFLVDVVGDWREERRLEDTWRLKPKTSNKPHIVEEKEAEDNKVKNLLHNLADDGIIWNGDRAMGYVKSACGTVETTGTRRLWVVGAREERGEAVLLSPALMASKGIRRLFDKHGIATAEWPKFPLKNGERVIGLPLVLRRERSEKTGMLIRLVALAAFNRLKGK